MKRVVLAFMLLGFAVSAGGCVAAAVGLGAGYGYEMHKSREERRNQ